MAKPNKPQDELSPLAEIDKLIHEPARLMIMANLYVVESADYTYLISRTGLTWGNISSHVAKLEEAGYIEVEKEFVDKKPHTMLHLTGTGRASFEEYRQRLQQFMDSLPE
jgi:DNA-binding MarR family transcriptional regulator